MKNRRFGILNLRFAILTVALAAVSIGLSSAQVSSGGDFTLEQKVIAGGGGASTDSTSTMFRLDGTIGQSAAGTQMTGGDFTQTGGFWAFRPFAPTAAAVQIGGRVIMANGRGIGGAVVWLQDLNGSTRLIRTNAFGYFRFTDVAAGQTIVLSVEHRRYIFSNPTLAIHVADDVSDVRFVAR